MSTAVFRDAEHAAAVIGSFLSEESTKSNKLLCGSGLTIGYNLSSPSARMVLDFSVEPSEDRSFDYYLNDESAPITNVELFMDGNTFDRFWRGEERPMELLESGKVEARGDIALALRMLPGLAMIVQSYKRFRQLHS